MRLPIGPHATNVGSKGSLDPQAELLYVPVGNAAPDFIKADSPGG